MKARSNCWQIKHNLTLGDISCQDEILDAFRKSFIQVLSKDFFNVCMKPVYKSVRKMRWNICPFFPFNPPTHTQACVEFSNEDTSYKHSMRTVQHAFLKIKISRLTLGDITKKNTKKNHSVVCNDDQAYSYARGMFGRKGFLWNMCKVWVIKLLQMGELLVMCQRYNSNIFLSFCFPGKNYLLTIFTC